MSNIIKEQSVGLQFISISYPLKQHFGLNVIGKFYTDNQMDVDIDI